MLLAFLMSGSGSPSVDEVPAAFLLLLLLSAFLLLPVLLLLPVKLSSTIKNLYASDGITVMY